MNFNNPTTQHNTFKQLLPLLFVIFIDTVGYFIVIPVIMHVFLHNEAGLLPADASLAYRDALFSLTLMLSPLAFIIFSPIIGHLSDRFGRKKALTSALFAACIGFVLPIIGITQKAISLILIGRLIAGASSSSQPVAQAGITDFTEGKQRALYLSLIGAAMTLGMVIGPVAGSLFSLENVTTPYWFAFALSLLNIVLLVAFYQNPQQQRVHKTSTKRLKQYAELIIKNKIWVLMLSFLLVEIAWSQYYQAAFLTLNQYFHYTVVKVTVFVAYVGLWMSIGLTVIYKYLIKRYSIESILANSIMIAALAFIACNIPLPSIQWIMTIPATICIGTAYPSLLHIMSHRSDTQHQGYILGFASTMLGTAWMLTGLIAGPLVANWFAWPNIITAIAMTLSYPITRYAITKNKA